METDTHLRSCRLAGKVLASIAAILLLFLLRVGPAYSVETPRKPNIIVILADDLGYGDLSCYGHAKFKTPRLDRMATEGVRMTQFNTPMPFCAPTRAALLTGRYPFRCGMPDNPAPDGGPKADATRLPASEVLLPQLLTEAGYATAMVGKWHLGHQQTDMLPRHRGFGEYLGILYSNDMRPVRLIEGDKPIEYPLVQATLTRRYTERTVDFIERNRERPFFLYLAHAMPHKPLAVSEEFYKKSGAGLYGDVMMELDAEIGRVLDKIKALGLDEQTLVLFTSDNGPWYGGSTGGLRGMKSTSWEGGYRVPMIARWPGKLPAGRTCDELAVTMDVFTTVLSAAGVAAPSDRKIDGADLLPVLKGESKPPHEVIFGQAGERLAAVRDARWKLHVIAPRGPASLPKGAKWVDPRGPEGVTILAPYEQAHPSEHPGLESGDPAKAMMLFDLVNDPGEQHDIAREHPEVVERLKKRCDELAQSNKSLRGE